MLTLRENSQDLENTINFVNNQIYFLTSEYTTENMISKIIIEFESVQHNNRLF